MFITNLPIDVQTIVRIKNPDTLEEALSYVLEEEEFQNFAKLHQTTNRISQPNFKPTMSQNNNPPPRRNFIPNLNQNITPRNTNNFPTTSQFPSQPINIQPKQVNQKFPTNKQTFGPPNRTQNVWKPNANLNQNFGKPTPMSGISHNSQFKPQPMSGISYMHNTEATEHIPSYHNEEYHNQLEYDQERYEDITYNNMYQEDQQQEEIYEEDQNNENFPSVEPTQSPT
ncbi:circumsporozoite protein-like [Anoplophora glabripennis]|uniref:circumsporozoite protein-like n=1 Tax=Anoplophora glabripennis TaxID=217634 RepID=UPI000C763604|nr:circumsporozoite protein-like [Anoplophora glabripennis]